jgi:hypothetical protein
MSVMVTRLPNEPILIADVHGRMDVEAVRNLFAQTAAFCNEVNDTVYQIASFLNVDASINDAARVLVEASRGARGSALDPQVKAVMVAGHNRVRLLIDLMRQKEFGGAEVPVFDTVDAALAFVREQIQQKGQQAAAM